MCFRSCFLPGRAKGLSAPGCTALLVQNFIVTLNARITIRSTWCFTCVIRRFRQAESHCFRKNKALICTAKRGEWKVFFLSKNAVYNLFARLEPLCRNIAAMFRGNFPEFIVPSTECKQNKHNYLYPVEQRPFILKPPANYLHYENAWAG